MFIGKSWCRMPVFMIATLVSGLYYIIDPFPADTHRQLLILQSPPFAIGAPTSTMNNLATRDGKSGLSSAQIGAIAGIVVAVGITYWLVTALVIANFRLGNEGYWHRIRDILLPCYRCCGEWKA
jgi:hypothetical protein